MQRPRHLDGGPGSVWRLLVAMAEDLAAIRAMMTAWYEAHRNETNPPDDEA